MQTTYADSGLQNGLTYYYKVSALNANGESPLSGQSSATPSGLVATGRAAADRRRLQPHGEPALRRRALDERDQRLGRDGPEHDLEHARMLEDDDLHRLA